MQTVLHWLWADYGWMIRMALFNVVLSALSFVCWKIRIATHDKYGKTACYTIDWMLTVLHMVMANPKNPISKTEVEEAMQKGMANTHEP